MIVVAASEHLCEIRCTIGGVPVGQTMAGERRGTQVVWFVVCRRCGVLGDATNAEGAERLARAHESHS